MASVGQNLPCWPPASFWALGCQEEEEGLLTLQPLGLPTTGLRGVALLWAVPRLTLPTTPCHCLPAQPAEGWQPPPWEQQHLAFAWHEGRHGWEAGGLLPGLLRGSMP